MIGYIILGLFFSCFLIFFIYFIIERKKRKFPEGKVFEYILDDYKAIVILDKNIKINNNKFTVKADEEFYLKEDVECDINDLIYRCSQIMKFTHEINKEFGFKELKTDKKIKECVFYFLYNEEFDKYFKKRLKYNFTVNGFSQKINLNQFDKKGIYAPVSRISLIPQTIETGGIMVHEFMHCYSDMVLGHFSPLHNKDSIWTYQVDGKTLEALVFEKIKNSK